MAKKLSLRDLDVKDKKVLVRVDFNVPLNKEGKITDDSRITASLVTICHILEHGGSVILMSHLGRPKGTPSPEFSLKPCAQRLSELLGKRVIMAPDCIGTETELLASKLQPGQVLMLENLRFHEAEENPKSDPTFAQKLASLGDLYVNDAFGTAHRAHASTTVIASFFPGKAAAGFLMENELQFLDQILQNPERPFYTLLGGAKISTKFGVIKALLKKVDRLLIGGGMAFTFLKAQGVNIGLSLHEDEFIPQAREILEGPFKDKLLLPEDHVITEQISAISAVRVVDNQQGISDKFMGVDIGPKTIARYVNEISNAKLLFWNGPMGVFEIPRFAEGTNALAQAIAQLSATTIVGGGESVAAVHAAGVADKITHISTGGGATLEYLEFGTLPGVEALSNEG